MARCHLSKGPPALNQRLEILWRKGGHPAAKDGMAALTEICDQPQPHARQAEQHASPIRGIAAPLDISRPDETVREETCRGKAEAKKLGEASDRRFLFVPKEKHGAHLLHRYVEVTPLAGA